MLLTGLRSTFKFSNSKILRANSYHEHSPLALT
jgi:hypothetical protein